MMKCVCAADTEERRSASSPANTGSCPAAAEGVGRLGCPGLGCDAVDALLDAVEVRPVGCAPTVLPYCAAAAEAPAPPAGALGSTRGSTGTACKFLPLDWAKPKPCAVLSAELPAVTCSPPAAGADAAMALGAAEG